MQSSSATTTSTLRDIQSTVAGSAAAASVAAKCPGIVSQHMYRLCQTDIRVVFICHVITCISVR